MQYLFHGTAVPVAAANMISVLKEESGRREGVASVRKKTLIIHESRLQVQSE
jgi:hypothetical protein